MLDISDMNAPSQVFIAASRALADLKRQAGSGKKVEDRSAVALEQAMLSLAPYVQADPRITAETIIANSTNTLLALVKAGLMVRPSPRSEEMTAISSHVVKSPEVEAAITWTKFEGVLSFSHGPRHFLESICEHDCPRRTALLIALKNQRPSFSDEILDVFAHAGPQTAQALIDAHKSGVFDLSLTISLLPLSEISLKEFAWLVANNADFDKLFPQSGAGNFPRDLPRELTSLIKMTRSNHGRLQLKSLEPSLVALCSADPGDNFYGFCSPQTYLLIDATRAR